MEGTEGRLCRLKRKTLPRRNRSERITLDKHRYWYPSPPSPTHIHKVSCFYGGGADVIAGGVSGDEPAMGNIITPHIPPLPLSSPPPFPLLSIYPPPLLLQLRLHHLLPYSFSSSIFPSFSSSSSSSFF